MTAPNLTPPVSGQYGAPMGRHGQSGAANGEKLYLQRVRLNNGGYDSGGAYWGHGAPLYAWCNVDGDRSGYLRARDREDAKAKLRDDWSDISFFR